MNRKDFMALATAIVVHNLAGGKIAFDQEQLTTIAEAIALTNPVFDKQRWIDYINNFGSTPSR